MFEKQIYECPQCGYESQESLEDGAVFVCSGCRARFRVLLDEETGRVGFVEDRPTDDPEPLYLPKGSIRAGVTVLMSLSCWIQILLGWEVPGYLLGLLLAVLGYYLGFRTKVKSADSRIFDATAQNEEPLFLPVGWVRRFLVAGFLLAGIILYARGRLNDVKYLEFFVIFFGLVAGYVIGRAVAAFGITRFRLLFNHVKGVAVILVAAYLAYLFIGGGYRQAEGPETMPIIFLCSVISFYFGSRS